MESLFSPPRSDQFKGVLWDNPSIILSITALYLWFVLKFGPQWMENRKAYRLKPLTRLFNACQVLANGWFTCNLTIIAVRNFPEGYFSFGCNPPTTVKPPASNEEDIKMIGKLFTLYFYVRTVDYLDTVFFVLTKKQSHVSFLHVYHHVIVVVSSYIYLRSGWVPSIFHLSILNASIHIIMYSYYFLSTFPILRPYLWWKKYMTCMQILQFLFLTMQLSWAAMQDCGYPPLVNQYVAMQTTIFFVLFARFYFKNYKPSKGETCARMTE
ncbi:elongation of very long chain fatty acids protein 1 [Galendromus occidentalis]|uniref:Elongation of very long chain fatty acids protein n=1 Tax=Galendromus occidentalis TaxID=34638 RepID=A0AAJ6QLY1_9ACAR|nr:elongation of very long chain fatty acids protein 1 [Galendromus occidentalis]